MRGEWFAGLKSLNQEIMCCIRGIVVAIWWALIVQKKHRYTREAQNLKHFYPTMWLKLEVFGFSRNQNNHGSSGAYVTCIYCSLRVKMTCVRWNAAWRLTHLFCICSCICGWQKKKNTQFEPMGDKAFTGGDIRELGSPLYICAKTQRFVKFKYIYQSTTRKYIS